MQNQDEAVEKIERVLKTFKQYSEEIEVVWCVQELVDAVLPSLNRKLYECLKDIRNNYIIEKIGYVCNDKDKKSLSSCDAYYGDTSPIVQEYRNEGKPVMIMDYMV